MTSGVPRSSLQDSSSLFRAKGAPGVGEGVRVGNNVTVGASVGPDWVDWLAGVGVPPVGVMIRVAVVVRVGVIACVPGTRGRAVSPSGKAEGEPPGTPGTPGVPGAGSVGGDCPRATASIPRARASW